MFDAVIPNTEHLFGRRHLRGTHEAEAEPLGISHVPDAFRKLGILLLPGRIGGDASGTTNVARGIIPRATANRMRIRLRGFNPWISFRFALIRRVGVEGPFHDVAEHVEQSPRIWLLGCDLGILAAGVPSKPGVIA